MPNDNEDNRSSLQNCSNLRMQRLINYCVIGPRFDSTTVRTFTLEWDWCGCGHDFGVRVFPRAVLRTLSGANLNSQSWTGLQHLMVLANNISEDYELLFRIERLALIRRSRFIGCLASRFLGLSNILQHFLKERFLLLSNGTTMFLQCC